MLRRVLFCAMIVGVLLTGAARAQQRAPTPQEINDIEALVTKAAALVESKGKEAAFAEFGKRNSEWWHGDTYLFAYDMNGNVLLNPAVPSRVGTNPTAEKDANGKAFHHALIEMGQENGSGWVDYLIARPGKPTCSATRRKAIPATLEDRNDVTHLSTEGCIVFPAFGLSSRL